MKFKKFKWQVRSWQRLCQLQIELWRRPKEFHFDSVSVHAFRANQGFYPTQASKFEIYLVLVPSRPEDVLGRGLSQDEDRPRTTRPVLRTSDVTKKDVWRQKISEIYYRFDNFIL